MTDMLRLGVTGEARPLTMPEKVYIRNHLVEAVGDLPDDRLEFFSGAAEGVDTFWFIQALTRWPNAHHHLVHPTNAHFNVALLLAMHNGPANKRSIHAAAKGSTRSDCYMNRNTLLAKLLGPEATLQAFPATAEEQRRSGTWATVRRARKVGATIVPYPLSEVADRQHTNQRRRQAW